MQFVFIVEYIDFQGKIRTTLIDLFSPLYSFTSNPYFRQNNASEEENK